jgi:hypothetical protein
MIRRTEFIRRVNESAIIKLERSLNDIGSSQKAYTLSEKKKFTIISTMNNTIETTI